MDQDVLHCLPAHERWAILETASGRPRTYFLREGTDALSPPERALVLRWAAQRHQGLPLAYLLGFREFYGHRFWVGPSVLIPRADTELLVDLSIAQFRPALRLLELGTGSGCIVISILKAAAAQGLALEAVATDISGAALAMARNNACWHGVSVQWAQGDWFGALSCLREPQLLGAQADIAPDAQQRFDLIVSNPPYVPANDGHLTDGDLRFEPIQALSGVHPQTDGLHDLAGIIAGAPHWLRPRGSLLIEHGWDQQDAVIALCKKAGFPQAHGLSDLSGVPRVVQARL